ncbi:hypothetical protein Y032_0001g189 [Ancylostoma ceylanicum]|uniref:ZP domain-containing protein n=1 Tax=Ancylostoma ceylanicum TaxID=53326 RepID=A0A016W327_9BILA|nr:hypothetical protein Y032_0001g189 [Ancylostoma ceylanicum]
MKHLHLLFLTWVSASASPRYSIENEIMGEPTVDCEDSLVGLTFKTKKPFSGRVYVYGMAGDEKCSRAFVENRNQSRMGSVGDKIYHVWQCDSLATGFLVHSCSVGDGRGERVDLIDVDGCAIDPAIQPDVFYEDSNRAVVEVSGYKFSDANVLNYECVLEVCRSAMECENLTPPKCDRDQLDNVFPRESLRRSRSIGGQELSSFF